MTLCIYGIFIIQASYLKIKNKRWISRRKYGWRNVTVLELLFLNCQKQIRKKFMLLPKIMSRERTDKAPAQNFEFRLGSPKRSKKYRDRYTSVHKTQNHSYFITDVCQVSKGHIAKSVHSNPSVKHLVDDTASYFVRFVYKTSSIFLSTVSYQPPCIRLWTLIILFNLLLVITDDLYRSRNLNTRRAAHLLTGPVPSLCVMSALRLSRSSRCTYSA